MTVSRRQLLGWGAGGIATLGLARAAQQGVISLGEAPGLQAWADWNRQRHSGALSLVAAGLLAASPHNSQPWQFAVGRLGVDLFEVPERNLGAMDPFGRERLAGLGAALHTMALASTRLGRAATVRLLPDPENASHMARIELDSRSAGAPPPHPLLAAIGRRHTHRGHWTGAPIGEDARQALAAFPRSPEIGLMLFEVGSAQGRRFAALTEEATAAIAGDAEMMAASHAWFRHSRAAQDRLKDGLTLATSGISPALAAAAAMLPAQSAATEGRYWLATTRDQQLPTASLFGVITAADPWDRRQALLAGATWARVHLIAASLGLAAQPLNQLPEMIDRERAGGAAVAFAAAAQALTGGQQGRVTFGFRLGHAAGPAGFSLRRPVSEVIGRPARLGYEVDRARAETAIRASQLELRMKRR